MAGEVERREWVVIVSGLKDANLATVLWRGWQLVPHVLNIHYAWEHKTPDQLLVEVSVWGPDVTDETSFTARFSEGPGATDTPLDRAPRWVRDAVKEHRPYPAAAEPE